MLRIRFSPHCIFYVGRNGGTYANARFTMKGSDGLRKISRARAAIRVCPRPGLGLKAVCGILASRMDEANAREFTSHLPEPLTLDLLRGHQENPPNISVEDAATTLVQQFHISREQARELFTSLTRFARDVAGREIFNKAARDLSPDWVKLFTG